MCACVCVCVCVVCHTVDMCGRVYVCVGGGGGGGAAWACAREEA